MNVGNNLVLIFCSILLNSCIFFGPSNQELFDYAYSQKPYDVIIVPGFPYDSNATEWDMAMKGRMYWSKYLVDIGLTKNVIFSGSSVYTPFIESKIMIKYGEKIGIDKAIMFAETKAEHSTENIYYSYYLAKQMGFEKIGVATDPFQARLLRSTPKRYKLKLDFIPFVIDSLKTMQMKDYVEINADSAKVENFESIVDRESRFKRVWGTLGKNIERVEEDVRNK